MIAMFPSFYPDELFYSVFTRYFAHSGYMYFSAAIKEVFGHVESKPSVEFLSKLTEDAARIISTIKPIDRIILEHTMFPYYSQFLSRERKSMAFKLMMEQNTGFKKSLYIPHTNTKRFLRFCPICSSEDRLKYGETYWHRSHQIHGINICPIHFCQLQDTEISLNSSYSALSIPAENAVPPLSTVKISHNKLEQYVSEYVYHIFQSPVNINSDTSIGKFLSSKMEYTQYASSRGERKRRKKLFDDIQEKYKSLHLENYNYLHKQWHLESTLSGSRFMTYEICLIAIALGISHHDLLDMRIPEVSQTQLFDNKVKELYIKGVNPKKIAREVDYSYCNILLMCKELDKEN